MMEVEPRSKVTTNSTTNDTARMSLVCLSLLTNEESTNRLDQSKRMVQESLQHHMDMILSTDEKDNAMNKKTSLPVNVF